MKDKSMENSNPNMKLLTIVLIVFLGFLGISMPYLIFPSLFINPEYSILPEDWNQASRALFLGITLAAYPLGQFFGSPILGALSDDYGRQKILTGSLLFAALCNYLTGMALDQRLLFLIILGRFATGFTEGNIAIARAIAADIKSISKHKTFGKINAAASIAYLIGPLIGGLLADDKVFSDLSSSTPFYLVSFLFLALSVFSFMMLRGEKETKERKNFWSQFNLWNRLKNLFQNKQLKFLLIVSTLFTLAVDIFYEFGPVYLTSKWLLTSSQLIIYNSILCIALAVGNGWLASYASSRYSSRRLLLISMGGFALLLIGMTLTNESFIMVGLFGLSGLLIGLGVTLLTVKISDTASNLIQGEVMGVQLSLRVLGDAVICLLGGLFLILSSKMILVVATFISAGTLIYYGKVTSSRPVL